MKLFKSYSEKEVKRVMPIVNKINSLEPEMEKLTDHELKEKTKSTSYKKFVLLLNLFVLATMIYKTVEF